MSVSQWSLGSTQLGSPSYSRSIPRSALEKIKLPSNALLIAALLCTQIPALSALQGTLPLKAMMLPAPTAVPPTVLSCPLIRMPPELARGCVPVISAPTILPWMKLPELSNPTITPVLPALPEIKLPGGAPGVAARPPMRLLDTPPLIFKPPFGLERAIVPVTSVPMKLPWTVLLDPPFRSTPRLFADIMLRASTVVPPMRVFTPVLKTPRSVFPKARVPVT